MQFWFTARIQKQQQTSVFPLDSEPLKPIKWILSKQLLVWLLCNKRAFEKNNKRNTTFHWISAVENISKTQERRSWNWISLQGSDSCKCHGGSEDDQVVMASQEDNKALKKEKKRSSATMKTSNKIIATVGKRFKLSWIHVKKRKELQRIVQNLWVGKVFSNIVVFGVRSGQEFTFCNFAVAYRNNAFVEYPLRNLININFTRK